MRLPEVAFGGACSNAAVPPQRAFARQVRRRRDSDLDMCVQVLREVHKRDGYPVNWPDDPAGWLSQRSLLDAWVAELDGRIAGHVGLSRSGPGDAAADLWSHREGVSRERAAMVSRLFVGPAARGHGLGALLMHRVVAEAHARRLHPVLDVVASDHAAAALYERLAWQRLGTVEQRWSEARTVTVHCYAAPPPGTAAEPAPDCGVSP